MAKILVVDDSTLSRRLLRHILELDGHQVIEAADGVSALEHYSLEKPDLVMLDLTMEEMHGTEVLSKLREMDSRVRVIVASADIQTATRKLVLAQGALDFIAKPFSAEAVLQIVTTVLQENQ